MLNRGTQKPRPVIRRHKSLVGASHLFFQILFSSFFKKGEDRELMEGGAWINPWTNEKQEIESNENLDFLNYIKSTRFFFSFFTPSSSMFILPTIKYNNHSRFFLTHKHNSLHKAHTSSYHTNTSICIPNSLSHFQNFKITLGVSVNHDTRITFPDCKDQPMKRKRVADLVKGREPLFGSCFIILCFAYEGKISECVISIDVMRIYCCWDYFLSITWFW